MKLRLPPAPFPHASRGFTLIELSIVLVIIGLIVGGVLVGRDMIEAAKIRSVISDVKRLRTATNLFRNRYNYLPGDLPYPERFFGEPWPDALEGVYSSGAATHNTAGNGKIDYQAESVMSFIQLSRAGLIEEGLEFLPGVYPEAANAACGISLPSGPFGGCYQLRTGLHVQSVWSNTEPYNWITYGSEYSGLPGTDYRIAAPVVSPLQAYQLDSKIDDGFATTGRVAAKNGVGGGFNPSDIQAKYNITPSTQGVCFASTHSYPYDNSGPNRSYRVIVTDPACLIGFRIDWLMVPAFLTYA